MDNLAVFTRSIFQYFKSFFGTDVDLVENDIRLVLAEFNSSFMLYEIEPGIYTFKDLSKAVFNNFEPEYELFNNSIDIEFL